MKRFVSLVAGVVAAAGLVAGCSSDSPQSAEPTSTSSVEVVTETETSTPPTLPAGYAPPIGEITSVRVELSTACASAIGPIRELTVEFDSGLLLDESANEVLNAALADGRSECSADEWALYQSDELNGWMNAATSAPEAPFEGDDSTDGDSATSTAPVDVED